MTFFMNMAQIYYVMVIKLRSMYNRAAFFQSVFKINRAVLYILVYMVKMV